MNRNRIQNFIQGTRSLHGWSQAELARRAGISRQLLYTIESGRSTPSVEVAVRIARALKASVEELFPLQDELPAEALPTVEVPGRFQLIKIRDRWQAAPCEDPYDARKDFQVADLIAESDGETVRTRALRPLSEIPASIVVCGCDPALSIAAHLTETQAERSPRALWQNVSSGEALRRLATGQCHLAGIHYATASGDGNGNEQVARGAGLPFEFELLPFASWEQGIMTRPGNPLDVAGLDDLLRPGVRFANREPGSSNRAMIDHYFAARNQSAPEADIIARSHAAGAMMVASGAVDAALGMRAVATQFGLHFIPILETHFDLVVPQDLAADPLVTRFLDTLGSLPCRRQISLLPGYDLP